MLKAVWQGDGVDLAKINLDVVEEVSDVDFTDMVLEDDKLAQWDDEDFAPF